MSSHIQKRIQTPIAGFYSLPKESDNINHEIQRLHFLRYTNAKRMPHSSEKYVKYWTKQAVAKYLAQPFPPAWGDMSDPGPLTKPEILLFLQSENSEFSQPPNIVYYNYVLEQCDSERVKERRNRQIAKRKSQKKSYFEDGKMHYPAIENQPKKKRKPKVPLVDEATKNLAAQALKASRDISQAKNVYEQTKLRFKKARKGKDFTDKQKRALKKLEKYADKAQGFIATSIAGAAPLNFMAKMFVDESKLKEQGKMIEDGIFAMCAVGNIANSKNKFVAFMLGLIQCACHYDIQPASIMQDAKEIAKKMTWFNIWSSDQAKSFDFNLDNIFEGVLDDNLLVNNAHAISVFCAAILTGLSLKMAGADFTYLDVLSHFSKVSGFLLTVKVITSAIKQFVIPKVYQKLTGYSYEEATFAKSMPQAYNWMHKVHVISKIPTLHIQGVARIQKAILELVDEEPAITCLVHSMAVMSPQIKARLVFAQKKLSILHTIVKEKSCVDGFVKPYPNISYFWGAPGVGKSFMTNQLFTYFMDTFHPECLVNPDLHMYQCQPTKHMDGYTNSVKVLVVDEFEALVQSKGSGVWADENLIFQLAGTQKTIVPQAQADKKGTVFLEPAHVVLLGNQKVVNKEGIMKSTEAYQRRLENSFQICIKPEFSTPSGRMCPVKMSKIPSYSAWLEGVKSPDPDFKHQLCCYTWSPSDSVTGVISAPLEWEEWARDYGKKFAFSKAQYEKTKKETVAAIGTNPLVKAFDTWYDSWIPTKELITGSGSINVLGSMNESLSKDINEILGVVARDSEAVEFFAETHQETQATSVASSSTTTNDPWAAFSGVKIPSGVPVWKTKFNSEGKLEPETSTWWPEFKERATDPKTIALVLAGLALIGVFAKPIYDAFSKIKCYVTDPDTIPNVRDWLYENIVCSAACQKCMCVAKNFKAKLGVLVSHDIPVPSQALSDMTRKTNVPCKVTGPPVAEASVAQGGMTAADRDAFVTKVNTNVYFFVVNGQALGQVTFYDTDKFICLKHFLENPTFTLVRYCDQDYSVTLEEGQYDIIPLTHGTNNPIRETVAVRVTRNITSHKKLINRFVTNDEIQYIRNDLVAIHKNKRMGGSVYSNRTNSQGPPEVDVVKDFSFKGKMFQEARSINAYLKSDSGDCGALLLSCHKSISEKLCGVLFAGGEMTSSFGLITREMLEATQKGFPTYDLEEPSEALGLKPGLNSLGNVIPGLTIMGHIRPTFTNTKNDCRKSAISDFIADEMPRMGAPSTMSMAWAEKSLSNYGLPKSPIPVKIQEQIFEEMRPLYVGGEPRLLNQQEVFYGIDYLNGINTATSCGWPLSEVAEKPGKKDFISGVLDPPAPKEHILMENVAIMEAKIKSGIVPFIFFSAALKGEILPFSAFEPTKQKQRIFQIGPLEYTYLFRKYFGAWCAYKNEQNIRNGCSSGSTNSTNDLIRLNTYLDRWSEPLYGDGDYSKFEARHCTSNSQPQADFINSWYGQNVINQEHDQIRNILWEMGNRFNVMFRGNLYGVAGGTASGFPGTGPKNDLANHCNFRWVFKQIVPETNFDENVSLITGGDDHMWSSTPQIPEFNVLKVAQTMKESGIYWTPADKDSEAQNLKKEELTFLGRNMKGELRESALRKMLHWVRNPDVMESTVINIQTALREYVIFGKPTYDEKRKLLMSACKKAGISPLVVWTYEEAKRKVYSSEYLYLA